MKNTLSYQSFLKSPYKSNKYSTYFEIYDHLFKKYRGKKITFVEIGVLGGGSLFMWRDFFGPEARIIGIDFNPNAKKWREHGFEIHIGDQSNEKFWEVFKKSTGMIDVILDDGGHMYDQQIITTEMLIENIKDDGLLVIEDTHSSYQKGFGIKKYSFIEYTKIIIDRINKRFLSLENKEVNYKIWSVQTFESIVAFRINRVSSYLESKKISNNGKDDLANDYRNIKIKSLKNHYLYKILNRIPIIYFLIRRFLLFYFILKKNQKTKRFF
jgi:hypothetical protein